MGTLKQSDKPTEAAMAKNKEDRAELKLRIPRDLKDWLVERADDRERSVNFIITKALMRAKAMEESL